MEDIRWEIPPRPEINIPGLQLDSVVYVEEDEQGNTPGAFLLFQDHNREGQVLYVERVSELLADLTDLSDPDLFEEITEGSRSAELSLVVDAPSITVEVIQEALRGKTLSDIRDLLESPQILDGED